MAAKRKSKRTTQLIQAAAASSWSAPLPRPKDLLEYNEIIPGAADRILTMTESQSEHRKKLEKRAVTSNIRQSYMGTFFAFILGMTALVGGIFLAYNDKGTAGITAIISALASLTGVFIYGKRKQGAQNQD